MQQVTASPAAPCGRPKRAITIARALSNTFAGIVPNNAPAFILSQLCGALIGLVLAKWLQIGIASMPRVNEVQINA
jgi:hypothetical protein